MATEKEQWVYAPPPGALDFVQNNFISNALRVVIHCFVRLSFRYYHRFKVIHAERLNGLGAAIIVANHASHLDTLALFSSFPLAQVNSLRALAAKDYFFSNPVSRSLAFFFANVIPIDRRGMSPGSLGFAEKELTGGRKLIIYPEGTRSVDGEIHSFRPGIGLLALRSRVPVVPLYIEGTYASQPKGMFFPRPRQIVVSVGEPVEYKPTDESQMDAQGIAQDLERRVRTLKEEWSYGH